MMIVPVYVVTHWNKYSKKFDVSIQSYEPYEGSDNILIAQGEFEYIPLPEPEMRKAAATILRAAIDETRADAQLKITELEGEIQELLALEDFTQRSAT